MGMFCQIIKEPCKTTECKMWEQDECIMIKYMLGRLEALESNKKRMDKWEAKPKQELPAEFVNLPERIWQLRYSKPTKKNTQSESWAGGAPSFFTQCAQL